jgi:glucokinase
MSSGRTSASPWLLADVGGTNVRFALAHPAEPAPLLLDSMRAYRVAEFPSLADAAKAYFQTIGERPPHAVFALAGPVRGDEVQMTNFPWTISRPQLQRELACRSVHLVNDFAALVMGLPLLTTQDVVALGPARAPIARGVPNQTFCAMGPGTGLGVAALAVRGDAIVGLETEGGHASFAPTTEDEIGVLRHLIGRFGRVSIERLLCGSGLSNLHQALCAMQGCAQDLVAPEEITARANAGRDPLSVRAVEMFCEMLGSVAGDFALAYGAWDGVYLAGGLLVPLQGWLRQPPFRKRFENKGRFASVLAGVPVAMIAHPQAGLLGAAGFAVRAAGHSLLRDPSPAAQVH